ncbi:FecR domain-containing protein [Geminicoccus harenae]|uniref:FecR domain-containing protein n=3 Tax=Geminicoccus harenae TaxID=2498453 RepID=UPI001C94FE61|nr:FecR domain-containing protein [Geminicoccus harenae]
MASTRGGQAWRCLLAGLLVMAAQANPTAGSAQETRIRVQDGQSLRDIAQAELGDPDLWTEILRANELRSPADVQPGMELVIPAGAIAAADRALDQALAAIQRATAEGARLFAPDEIEQGIASYDAGVARRKAGDWAGAAEAAGEARQAAAAAMQLVAAGRDSPAEARLTDREGRVEGRTPQELVWSDRADDAVLIEEEKVRTLSRSSAQITFRDNSRLRLNANSQAVIRRMRTDPLSRTEEASVSLVEGDFYALLSGQGPRKRFELQVPEVDTDVQSRSFWVRHDGSGSKFTNYDEGVLRVAANGREVALGRNEATLVRAGQRPSDKVGIRAAAVLLAPPDNGQTVTADVGLRWAPVEEAAGYWLELAHDPGFQRMQLSRWGLKDTGFATGELPVGTYYWRVAALDRFGLPGERGATWRFHVRVDQAPPFLVITEPPEHATLTRSPMPVRGQTEPGARLLVDGLSVAVAGDGSFATEVALTPSNGQIRLQATDPAGNVTERQRTYRFVPDEADVLRFDAGLPQLSPRHFVTRQDPVSLTGSTLPGARLLLRAAGQPLREATYADKDGRFTLNVPVTAGTAEYGIEVVQRSGRTSREAITVSLDRDPPSIGLDLPPPAITAVEWLPLRGRAEGAVTLSLNGQPVQLIDGTFDQTVTLVPGINRLRLEATDLVGNVRVANVEVRLDQQAPELVGYRVSPPRARPGQPLRVEVQAKDASGLRQLAPARLRVAGVEYDQFLELGAVPGTYAATVLLPPDAAGPAELREVEIEDYAGNKARFSLGR